MNAKALRDAAASCPAPPSAQGFAGLSDAAGGFAPVTAPGSARLPARPRRRIPDFRIEWWYLTANLRGAGRRRLRRAVDAVPLGAGARARTRRAGPTARSGWRTPPRPAPTRHRFAETFARGGVGQAGVEADARSAPGSTTGA